MRQLKVYTTQPTLSIQAWFFLLWFCVCIWLLACAYLVRGESGDGYMTILNARYFFGDSVNPQIQRGPLVGLALWPIEMIASFFQWSPIDVRPYHFYSGLFHSLYLLGCWFLLKRLGGTATARLLAFLAAILSVVFYAYAPYLSHDIIPGFLFLLFIFIFHRWLANPNWQLASCLVLLGLLVTFIKQTYALFWLALVVYSIIAYFLKWNNSFVTGRKLFVLFFLAGISAALCWIGYAIFIAPGIPEEIPFLVRPLALISSISNRFGSPDDPFAWEIYLINGHNYGLVAMLLVLPGIYMSWRHKDSRLRTIAVCWVISFLVMHLLKFKEVRYLAFLAPLTACLIVPVIGVLLKRRTHVVLLILLVLYDQYRGWGLAARELSSTAKVNVERFIGNPNPQDRIVMSRVLPFVYLAHSPLIKDRYHGVYHFPAHGMPGFFGAGIEVVEVRHPGDLGTLGVKAGDKVYYSTGLAIRVAPWRKDNEPAELDSLITIVGEARSFELIRKIDHYQIVNGLEAGPILLIPDKSVGQKPPVVIEGSTVALSQVEHLYGGLNDSANLRIMGIVVDKLCHSEQCFFGAEDQIDPGSS